MNKRNKIRPLSPRDSRAYSVKAVRSSPLTNRSRAFKPLQKTFMTPLSQARVLRQRAILRKKSITSRLGHVISRIAEKPSRVLKKQCRREWSKILSWRSDQKKTGSGGRKRNQRSQREKAASAAKHFKDC